VAPPIACKPGCAGYPLQSASFSRLTDAKRATQTKAVIRERRHFRTPEAEKHTFAELADRYIRELLLPSKPKGKAKQTAQLMVEERDRLVHPGRDRNQTGTDRGSRGQFGSSSDAAR
jgi:hypothetical protein